MGLQSGYVRQKKRGTLPKTSIHVLKEWLMEHFMHPYVTHSWSIHNVNTWLRCSIHVIKVWHMQRLMHPYVSQTWSIHKRLLAHG